MSDLDAMEDDIDTNKQRIAALEDQDNVHWKTRRTLLSKLSAAEERALELGSFLAWTFDRMNEQARGHFLEEDFHGDILNEGNRTMVERLLRNLSNRAVENYSKLTTAERERDEAQRWRGHLPGCSSQIEGHPDEFERCSCGHVRADQAERRAGELERCLDAMRAFLRTRDPDCLGRDAEHGWPHRNEMIAGIDKLLDGQEAPSPPSPTETQP